MFLNFKKYKLIYLLFILSFIISCKNKNEKDNFIGHKIWSENDTLKIEVLCDADFVTFKMFEGLYVDLEKKSSNKFFAEKEIKGIDSTIFQYSIIIQKKGENDSLISIDYKPEDSLEYFFIWKGKYSKDFTKYNEILRGSLIDTIIESKYLNPT